VAGGGQPLEPRHRGGALRVGAQDGGVGGEGGRGVPEARLLDLADAQQQFLTVLGGARRQVALQRLQQARPVLARLQHAHQRAQRALVGLHVGRIDAGDALQRGAGGGEIADLLLLELRDAEQHLQPLGRVGRAIGAGVQQLGQVGPGLGLRQDLLQRRLRLVVAAGGRGQDLLGEAARVGRLVEAAERDAQRPAQKAEALLGRHGPLGRLQASGEEARQRAPLVGLGGQALEVGGHLGVGRRDGVGTRAPLEGQRLRAQALLADAARLLQKLQLLGGRRPARVARGGRPHQHLVRGQKARPLLRRAVKRDQRHRRAPVVRVRRQDPLVGLQCALRLVQLLQRQQRHPFQKARPRRHVGRAIGEARQLIAQVAERPLLQVQRLKGGEVARLGVDLAQRAHGARVARLQLLDAAEDLGGGARRPQLLEQQRPLPF
jgi:hypothetical protein